MGVELRPLVVVHATQGVFIHSADILADRITHVVAVERDVSDHVFGDDLLNLVVKGLAVLGTAGLFGLDEEVIDLRTDSVE